MTEQQMPQRIKETECYANYENYLKTLVVKNKNINRLYDLYGQASRYGIAYLKQNPNISTRDIKLIEELITKNK